MEIEYNLDNQLALLPPLFLPLNIIPKYFFHTFFNNQFL